MATRTLTVNLVGRADKLVRSFKNASRGADTMAGKMMQATRMAGIGFGALAGVAVGAAAALKPMIDKAASMEESLSKNRVVFGESSKAIEAFAETSLHSFGVTERAALEATGVIGTLGTAMGMTASDSAEMATTLVGLAGDMSSFNDASVEETLTAIQAGLRGEAEPLRRFGVLLDAATLKAKALQKGIITSTKDALTPQQKALAAYAVILEQTSIQMGDFTRTADSATNQSKLLAGEWDNIQTEIGTALLPAFTSIVTHLNESVLPAVKQFWSDPSWYEGGVLAGKVVGSGLVQGMLDAVRGVPEEEINDLEFWDSWKASAELNFAASAIGAAWKFINGVEDTLEDNDPFDPETIAGRGRRAAGRPAEEATGTPATNVHNIVSDLENLADAVVSSGVVVPSPALIGGPPGTAPAAAAAGGFQGMPPSSFTAINTNTGLNAEQALRMLSDPTSDFSRFLAPRQTGPPGTPQTVNNTFNITGVSPTEVMDAIGQDVALNGPLPPHWQQGAN